MVDITTGDHSGIYVDRCSVKIVGYDLANTSETAIPYDTETYDTNSMHEGVTNPDRITIKTAGFYDLCGSFNFTENLASADRVLVRLRVNASSISYLYDATSGATHPPAGTVTALMYELSVDDYVTFTIYQNFGDARTVNSTLTVRQVPFL